MKLYLTLIVLFFAFFLIRNYTQRPQTIRTFLRWYNSASAPPLQKKLGEASEESGTG